MQNAEVGGKSGKWKVESGKWKVESGNGVEDENEEDCPETLKLRNEPNFFAKNPMKVHKCPKNEPNPQGVDRRNLRLCSLNRGKNRRAQPTGANAGTDSGFRISGGVPNQAESNQTRLNQTKSNLIGVEDDGRERERGRGG